MGVPEIDALAKSSRHLELDLIDDSAKIQEAEPPPRQILTVLFVAIDAVTQSHIINQLSHPDYQIGNPLADVDYQFHIYTTFNLALDLLEKKKLDVDLVLSNVSLKVEDSYIFIAQVQSLGKNIPHVVIFEAEELGDHEINTAYELGACHILRKPVSQKSDEIGNLWQHVFRRRVQKEGSSSLVSSLQESLKRENKFKFMNHDEEPALKKQRMVWSKELNALFVEVVNKLGRGAVPKQILEVMNQNRLTREQVGSLTREQVASHLQKHKEKEKKKELHQPHHYKRILEVMNQKLTREQVGSLTREQVASHLQKHKEKEKKKELHQPHHFCQQ